MNQKLIIRLGGAAVAVFVLTYAASPLLAARSLVQAARTGDEKALERQVDLVLRSLDTMTGARRVGTAA